MTERKFEWPEKEEQERILNNFDHFIHCYHLYIRTLPVGGLPTTSTEQMMSRIRALLSQPAPESAGSGSEQKVKECLSLMMKSDAPLYEKILDTPGFAYWFNELIKIALSQPAPEPPSVSRKTLMALIETIRTDEWDDGWHGLTEAVTKILAVDGVPVEGEGPK